MAEAEVVWRHEATVAEAMAHTGAEVRIWPVENTETGLIDCVIGPCDVEELFATMRVLSSPGLRIEKVARWR